MTEDAAADENGPEEERTDDEPLEGTDDVPEGVPPEARRAANTASEGTREVPDHVPAEALQGDDPNEADAPTGRTLPAPEWPVTDTAVEYETGWYTGGYDLVEQPDGTEKRYYWADLPDAVVVVPIVDDEVVFVEQYRPTIRQTQLELPAGIVEDGESYAVAGRRELREETGLDAARTYFLQEYACATGVLRHDRGIVVATDCTEGERDLDDNEFLSVKRVPVEEAVAKARAQPTNDATVEGLLLAKEDGHL